MTGAAKRKAELQRWAIHPGELDLKDDKAILQRMSPFVAQGRRAARPHECPLLREERICFGSVPLPLLTRLGHWP